MELATYLRPMDGGPAVRLGEGLASGLSPDGAGVARIGMDHFAGRFTLLPTGPGEGFLYPTAGEAEPRPIPGFAPGDHMRQWSADGRFLYVSERYAPPARVARLDLATGERTPWRVFSPADPAGIVGTTDPSLTPDGSAWAYSVLRHLNDPYLVEGLR